jgi:hypothetical protein
MASRLKVNQTNRHMLHAKQEASLDLAQRILSIKSQDKGLTCEIPD